MDRASRKTRKRLRHCCERLQKPVCLRRSCSALLARPCRCPRRLPALHRREPSPRDARFEHTSDTIHSFQQAAESGQTNHIYTYAQFLDHGLGCEEDPETAAELYRQIAEVDHTGGQLMLAMALLRGRGVDKNEKEAVEWLHKCVAQEAEDITGSIAQACYHLGCCYRDGIDEKNAEQAAK